MFFAVDASLPDHEWGVEGVPGDRLTSVIRDLSLDTVYYVRVQARNANGYGPMTPSVSFRTPDRRSLGACLYGCVCIYIYMYICIYICIYIYVGTQGCIHVYIYICMQVFIV